MSPTPGVLYVTMQPSPDLPAEQFQDWYNNEHGPLRVRLSSFIKNGFRYRATDLDDNGKGKPEWMAIYDISDVAELTKDEYTKLRGPPVQSQRERDLRPKVSIDRRTFDSLQEWKSENFERLESIDTVPAENCLVSVDLRVKDEQELDMVSTWFKDKHMTAVRQTRGWLRTRILRTSSIDEKDYIDFLAIHELSNTTHSSPAAELISTLQAELQSMASPMINAKLRSYNLHYIFGPAPRDLTPLRSTAISSFSSSATSTYTFPSSNNPAIESYITTSDNVRLRYRLEGFSDSDAPLLVFSNCILTDLGLWDSFVSAFLVKPQNKRYRILRYDARGRTSDCGTKPITMEVHAADIVALLDALRIPRAYAAIGVSMGGATVLCAALTYPNRFPRFLSCDTNAKAPASNRKAWDERIELARIEGMLSPASNELIVGEELAEKTTRRWFTEQSYDGGEAEKECLRVKEMVKQNSLDGFEKVAQALCEYDFQDKLAGFRGIGRFLVGKEDGVLPKTMKEMAEKLGSDGSGRGGTELVVIEGAGHVPMVEKPEVVADAVTRFLEETGV